MIDQNTIDRIIDSARIEEVVGEFVTLRKRGINYVGLCPFHDEKTPSFSVSPSKGIFKCFGCGKGGNVVHFIMEHEQVNYYDALKWLAKKYNIEIVEKELSETEKKARSDRESLFIVNEFAKDYFIHCLHENEEGKMLGSAYLRERGFREDIIKKFQLGYSLDTWDNFSREANLKGYKKDFLIKTGLSLPNEQGELHDRFRARVMFPVFSLSGKVVAFGGRIMKKDEKSAKYVNSPESEIYHKSNELYGIYLAKQAIAKNDRCYLVEGYFDVMAMHQSGIENVVASSGTALTHGQIRLIHRFTNNVTVLYDGDSAGIHASLKGINLLLEEGLNVRVLLLPDGEDPDSFSHKQSATSFQEYIRKNETDFIHFKTEILMKDAGNDPVAKARLIQDIVESISLISDDITRSVYVRECGSQLSFSEGLLQKEVDKKRIGRAERENMKPHSDYKRNFNSGFSRNDNVRGDIPSQPAPEPATQEGLVGAPQMGEAAETQEPDTISIDNLHSYPFDQYESNILKYVIRYGKEQIFKKETAAAGLPEITVTEFFYNELKKENIVFRNPWYQKILEEAEGNIKDPDFKSERHFLNHIEPEISMIAADLITEPYELSKIHSKYQVIQDDKERLNEIIPHVLIDLKYAVLQQAVIETEEKLKIASENNDEEQVRSLSLRLQEALEVKKDLAKYLGERIVVRR